MKKEIPETTSAGKTTIIEHVGLLESSIPRTHCVGDQLYSLKRTGVWELVPMERYQPICMNNMPLTMRTARRCDEVMRTFNRLHQKDRSLFKPACRWPEGDHDRNVCLINCRNGVLLVGEDAVDMDPPATGPDDVCYGSQIMAGYDPKAKCDSFNKVIKYAFQSRESTAQLPRLTA